MNAQEQYSETTWLPDSPANGELGRFIDEIARLNTELMRRDNEIITLKQAIRVIAIDLHRLGESE